MRNLVYQPEDVWILSEYDNLIKETMKMEAYDIYSATQKLKVFMTGIFSSHWMELAKADYMIQNQFLVDHTFSIERLPENILPVCPCSAIIFPHTVQ